MGYDSNKIFSSPLSLQSSSTLGGPHPLPSTLPVVVFVALGARTGSTRVAYKTTSNWAHFQFSTIRNDLHRQLCTIIK